MAYEYNASLTDLQNGTVEYFDVHRERMKEKKKNEYIIKKIDKMHTA